MASGAIVVEDAAVASSPMRCFAPEPQQKGQQRDGALPSLRFVQIGLVRLFIVLGDQRARTLGVDERPVRVLGPFREKQKQYHA